jgi:AraC-like DNA-binding protein
MDKPLLDLGFTSWSGPAPAMARAHRHHEVELNFVHRGGLTYLIRGGVVRVPPRRLTVFWAAVPHRMVEAERGTEFTYVTLPVAWLLAWPVEATWRERLLAGEITLAAETADDEVAVRRWSAEIRSRDRAQAGEALLEIEARLRRLAREEGTVDQGDPGLARTGRAEPAGAGALHAERMARWVAEHFRSPLSLSEVAGEVGLNPNYAATVFRRHWGVSLQQYWLQHRIHHAQRLLATTDRKVIDVALECGFATLSSFYEAFRRRCGCAPRAYRESVAHGPR